MLERVRSALPSLLFRLEGRVAFISGAAGHLGRSMAKGLAEVGAHVVLAGRTEEKLTALVDEFLAEGLDASAAVVDVTDAEAVQRAFARIREEHGRLDVLLNNAYEGASGTLETASVDAFARAYDVAVIGAFRCIVAAKSLLRSAVQETGNASVINIASMYGVVSPDLRTYDSPEESNPPFYGAAKAALLQLTRYAACEYAREGIRVNAVSPGPFPKSEICTQNPTFHQRLCAKTPLGRVGEAEELKGVVVFLASDAATYVTGINVPVDGGWTAW